MWNQNDIDSLKAAVASGILTVRYDGPPGRTITYQSLGEMRSLLAEMQRSVTKAPNYRLVQMKKGF